MELSTFVNDFADALAELDRTGAKHKDFKPGIGPFGETEILRRALTQLKAAHTGHYGDAQTKRLPDLLIPGAWGFEMKIVRPFGDNGKSAEHWSENVLHPYPGNTSSLGDCMKLLELKLPVRKAVIIFGFEHSPAQLPLDPAIHAFERIASDVLGIRLGPGTHTRREGLIHPFHQVLRVFGYEVLGREAVESGSRQ